MAERECDRRGCTRPSMWNAHCPVCHLTFGTVEGYSAHRYLQGKQAMCLHPSGLGYYEDKGIWRK